MFIFLIWDMEPIDPRGKENLISMMQSKKNLVGAHANAINTRNISDIREINKWMDALCLDPTIAKKVLWEDIYEEMKPKLQISKPFLNIEDKETILALPEFQSFLKTYTIEQEKKANTVVQNNEIEAKKALLSQMDIAPELSSAKERIETIKAILREIITEKEEKNEWTFKTFGDFIKKSALTEEQKKEKTNTIYDFVFDFLESTNNKKKRKTNQTSGEFYKNLWSDFCVKAIRDKLIEQERKINEKITISKQKASQKVKPIKTKILEKRNYTQEAYNIFFQDIQHNTDLRARFYMPIDQEDIVHIQSYFQKNLEETIPSPKIEDLIKDYEIRRDTIGKEWEKIKVNVNNYIDIEARARNFKEKFTMGMRDPKEYLFDRLVEYVGKDILSYKVNKDIKTKSQYKGMDYKIYKTDPLDDSSWGADYMVMYSFRWDKDIRLAAIDLFVSDKERKKNVEEDEAFDEGSLEAKLAKAKEEKIPYSSYIKLFSEKKEGEYKMQPIMRYVEQEHPMLTYSVLKSIITEKNVDITALLDSFQKKGKLYTSMENHRDAKHIREIIQQQFDKDTARELQKIAA